MNKIEIKKFANASASHGRGSDNYRVPARYDVVIDGVVVGKLWGKAQSYMGASQWEIARLDGEQIRPLQTIWNGGKKAAIAWVHAHAENFLQKSA